MRFFRMLRHFRFDAPAKQTTRTLSSAPRKSKNWEKSVGVLEELEVKQTVTDAIVPLAAGLQFSGMATALSAVGDSVLGFPLGSNEIDQAHLLQISTTRQAAQSVSVLESQAAIPQASTSSVQSNASVVGTDDGMRSWSYRSASSPANDSQQFDSGRDPASGALFFPLALDSTQSDGALSPKAHGQIRKLQLLPPLPSFGASTTVSTGTGDALPQREVEIAPAPENESLLAMIPIPAKPTIPIPQQQATNPTAVQEATATEPQATSTGADAKGDPGTSGGTQEFGVKTGASSDGATAPVPSAADESSGSESDDEPVCGGGETESGQSGGNSGGFSGGGSSCTPTSQLTASNPDPLFVLDWHEGLVMFPNVVEYDQPGDWVELRAQVRGATVQSWSWDTSQANRDGCIAGSSTYKLQFRWSGSSSVETTEYITITATMTDNSTMQEILTFKVAPGNSFSCPSAPTTTWPLLAPDKPLESQNAITSDSPTRPYAISQQSGIVYVGHSLPSYNPGMPALGLTYASIAADRQPIFVNRYQIDPAGSEPSTVSARLQFNGSWGSSKLSYAPKLCPEIVHK